MAPSDRDRGFHGRGLLAPARLAAALLILLTARASLADSLEGAQCTIRFPAHARRQAERLAREFAPQRERAALFLGIQPQGRPTLHLVEDYAGMRRMGGRGVPKWAAAIARSDDVLVFRLDLVDRNPADALELVLAHEVVHQVLDHLGGRPLPRWFEEGLCVYHAGVPFLQTDYPLDRAAAGGNLPRFAELDESFRADRRTAAVAYEAGHSVVIHFLKEFGPLDLRDLLQRVSKGAPFEAAFLGATGVRLEDFEEKWRESVTPAVPFLVYILLENIELTLIVLGALIVVGGYLQRRLRRRRALEDLEDQD